ncbi:MAG: hypothetical protein V1821_02990 [bacterium]
MEKLQNHPHKYALDLLRVTLDHMPDVVPEQAREEAHRALDRFTNDPGASLEAIELEIAKVGKLSWPYRKAYEDFFEQFGEKIKEELFIEELSPEVREKYLAWCKVGNNFKDLRNASKFDRDFVASDRFLIEEALLSAEEGAKSQIDGQITGERQHEYQTLLQKYQETEELLLKKLAELKSMAAESEKWSPEILNKVRLAEEGFSGTDREIDSYTLDKEIEYWRGVIDVETEGVS